LFFFFWPFLLLIPYSQISRVIAIPFAWNTPSVKVLKKGGFHLDCTLSKAFFKENKLIDGFLFSQVRPNL
jgi:RimJ/RimL family protein N-acetyltransferase